MWGYANNLASSADRVDGFDNRESALIAAKEKIREEGIPGRHTFYTFRIEKDSSLDAIKKHQYVLNAVDVVPPSESLEELYELVLENEDSKDLSRKLYIKIAAMLWNYKIQFSELRPHNSDKKIHLIVRDTFTVDGYHRDRGDHLCHGEYEGFRGICHNCAKEFIKLNKLIENGALVSWKVRKTVMIIDFDENSTDLIKEIFRDMEVTLSVSRAESINKSRSQAALLMPSLTLINAAINDAYFLAEEMRRNGLEVIMYGKNLEGSFKHYLTLPNTLAERDVFFTTILQRYYDA